MNYEPNVLRRHAKSLYTQAAIEIAILTSLGLLAGYWVMTVITPKPVALPPVVVQPASPGTIPAASGNRDTYHDRDNSMQYVPVGIGSLIGLLLGIARANSLRVKAQSILCQVSIEENTNHRVPAKY
jgi:hypothetical protein